MRNPEQAKKHRKTFYDANSEKVKSEVAQRKRELAAWMRDYKSTLSCTRCPESHPACLEFHHTDPTQKDLAVAKAVGNGWGRERILKEISKCIVLCANCHRKEHAKLELKL